MQEAELVLKAREELLKLGYRSSEIRSEFIIQDRYKADIVIWSDDKPYLVVEVKLFSYNIGVTNEHLKYNPAVKQAQSYASILKAPFFAVYNGTFLWFSTDKSGRPELRQDAVLPLTRVNERGLDKTSLVTLLQQLRNYMIHNFGYWSIEQVGLLLYAQILDESGATTVKEDLIKGDFAEYGLNLPINSQHPWEKEILKEIFSIIDRIRFSETNKSEFLLAVDEVFNQARQSLFVPRWISDLMIKISELNEHEKVIDLSSSHSNVLAALLFNFPHFPTNSITGVYPNIQSEYWLKFQERLIANIELTHHKVNISKPDFVQFKTRERFDKIFIAPIFGSRFSYHSEATGQTITDNLEISLEKGLQMSSADAILTFIAPETFLFSDKFKRARQGLAKVGQILAMVSLPIGAFDPYSSVKTSIIVFKKGRTVARTFIAKIESAPSKDTFDCTDIPQLRYILPVYLEKTSTPSAASDFYLNPDQIDFKNLSNAYYANVTPSANKNTYESYPLIRVSKFIKRGASIRLDEKGKVPFINPKSVRELNIDEKSLGLTIESNIPENALRAQPEDVLVNAISTYKGEAALVNKEISGLAVSQHVILIRPDKDIIMPEYLAILLNSGFLKVQFEQISSGAVIRFIPVGLIKDISIPVPPKHIQKKVIDKVKAAQQIVKSAEEALKKSKEKFEQLLENINVEEEEL